MSWVASMLFYKMEGVLTSSQGVLKIQVEITATRQHWILMAFSEYIVATSSRAMEAGLSPRMFQRTFALRFREIWGVGLVALTVTEFLTQMEGQLVSASQGFPLSIHITSSMVASRT